MRHAIMVVSGVLVVLLCADDPAYIPIALLGLATGVVLRTMLNKKKGP